MAEKIKVMLEDGSYPPLRAHPTDAGLDLSSRDEDFWLWVGQSHVFDTGVHIALPKGTCGIIMSRSGLNLNHGIVAAGNGVLDDTYTGSIRIKIYNMGKEGYLFKKGERIAQLLILDCHTEQYEIVTELEETDRGDSGFGSTGRTTLEGVKTCQK